MLSKIISILLVVTLFSCNPFISKELRRKNKCNRKLERVVNKCPELLNQDTIRDTVVFNIPEVRIDSFITVERDTSILELIPNDTIKEIVRNYIVNHKVIKDTITHVIDGYTFKFFTDAKGDIGYLVTKPEEKVEEIIEIPVDVVKPIQLTIGEQIMNVFASVWRWGLFLLVIIILLYLGYKFLKGYFNRPI